MAYVYDQKKAQDYNCIPKGEYEVYIEKMRLQETPNNKKKVAIQFRIRSDVDQAFQNRVLFEDLWQEKDSGLYNTNRLNKILNTQPIEDGKTFENIEEIITFLEDKPLMIGVYISFDEYLQEDVNKISYFKAAEHEMTPQPTEDEESTELPFE